MSVVRTSVRCMGEVSSAVDAILAGVAALQAASVEELSHREIITELSRVSAATWMLPAMEHRLLNRLVSETEPHRLGESSWTKVLRTALRVSGKDARRRLREAAHLGPRRGLSGQPLPPVWEATAAAQARGAIGPEHVAVIAAFHKRLPGWVDVDTREVADAQLAGLAAGLGPEVLDAAAGELLMMDDDRPGRSPTQRVRTGHHRGITLGNSNATAPDRSEVGSTPRPAPTGKRSSPNRPPPAGATPTANRPPTTGAPPRAVTARVATPALRRSATTTRSKPSAAPSSRRASWASFTGWRSR